MTTLPADLPLTVDRAAVAPLAVQISAQLQSSPPRGGLRGGARLPSSRDLAATLGVSRTVVTNAYARLFAEGWLEGRHGSGTYVADVTPATLTSKPPTGSIAQTSSIAALKSASEPDGLAATPPAAGGR